MKDERNPAEAYRNSYIKRCFRDTADRDYISARLLCRHHLIEQFLWMALQSIEKYLKAILLFHDKDTRHLGHKIVTGLNEVRKIERLGFSITEQAEEFIHALEEYGPDRYFELPRSTTGDELSRLDSVVWQVRRFCDDFFYPHDEPVFKQYDQKRLQFVQGKKIHQNQSRFRLDRRGFIETVLEEKKHPELRKALIWNNLFYGRRNRQSVRYIQRESWAQSAPYLYPQVYEWAIERVKLSPAILEAMRRLNKEQH